MDPAIADGLPDEVSGEGYLNSLSPLQLEQYLAIADKVLDRILAPEGARPTDDRKSGCSVNLPRRGLTLGGGAEGRPVSGPEGLSSASVARRNWMSCWGCSTWEGETNSPTGGAAT